MDTPTRINTKVSASLMKNYVSASAIDMRHEIAVAQDAAGNPIFFSIGTTGEVFAIIRDEKVPTGWAEYPISPNLNGAKVDLVTASQAPTGEIVLAIATSKGEGADSSVYITPSLSNDLTQVAWDTFAGNWVARPAGKTGLRIEKLLAGDHINGQTAPLLIATVRNTDTYFDNYIIEGDASKSAATWTFYDIQLDATEVLDLVIGRTNYGRGIYLLFKTGKDLHLRFQSLPDEDEEYFTRILTPPANAVALQAITDVSYKNRSTLFVSGTELYLFESDAQGQNESGTLISNDQNLQNLTDLVVRQDENAISVWCLNNRQELWYLSGEATKANRDWSVPLKIKNNVAQIAAQRNAHKYANEIFYVYTNNSIGYAYQDPTSTLWQSTDIQLPPPNDELQEINTYTTTVSFTDEKGMPLIGHEVSILSSQWTYSVVNGYLRVMDNDSAHPTKVTTDSMGKLTLITRANTLSTPVYTLTSDLMAEEVIVNPMDHIRSGLTAYKTGEDLKKATDQEGNFVVKNKDLDDAALDDTAEALQYLLAVANDMPTDGSVAPTDGSSPSTGSAAKKASPQVWGMTFDQGARMHKGQNAVLAIQGLSNPGHTASRKILGGDLVEGIVSIAGDVFSAIWEGIEAVGSFVVQQVKNVVQFVVELGGKILVIVLDTIGTVLEAINWILEKVLGISLADIIKWLGFIFSWGDILNTADVLANMMLSATDSFGEILETAGEGVTGFIDSIIAEVETADIFSLPLPDETVYDQVKQTAADQGAQPTGVQENPGTDFYYYQLQHNGMAETEAADVEASGPILTFIDEVLNPMLDDFENIFKEVYEQIGALQAAGELSVKNILKVVSKEALVGLLNAIKDLINGIIAVAGAVVSMFQDIVTMELPIPFFRGLYHLITGGDDFSILNVFSLLLAIPTTIGYKLVFGEAPFKDSTYGLDTMSYTDLLKALDASVVDTKAKTSARSVSASDVLLPLYDGIGTVVYGTTQIGFTVLNVYKNLFKLFDWLIPGAKRKVSIVDWLIVVDLLANWAFAYPVGWNQQKKGAGKIAGDLDISIYSISLLNVVVQALGNLTTAGIPRVSKYGKLGMTAASSVINLALATFSGGFSFADDKNQHKVDTGFKIAQNWAANGGTIALLPTFFLTPGAAFFVLSGTSLGLKVGASAIDLGRTGVSLIQRL